MIFIKATFRNATNSDVEAIVDLCNECFFENTTYEYAKNNFNQNINDENQINLIGTVEDKIVAYTRITVVSTMFEGMENYAILNHVCVKPDYRRHNIATDMLEEVERICKNRGCITIKLWSNNVEKRKAAHGCYQKYGFSKIDTTFYSKDI